MKNKVYLHGEAKKVKQKRIISTRRQQGVGGVGNFTKGEFFYRKKGT